MPLPQLPVVNLDNPQHRKRHRETTNSILTHQFDDSKVRTPAERLSGVMPFNQAYAPGELLRLTANPTPGTTDLALPFQQVVESSDGHSSQVRFQSQVAIGKTIRFGTGTTQNLSIIGNGRLSAGLEPASSDISVSFRDSLGYPASSGTAAEDVNALFFNASPNGHLHLEHFNYSDDQAFVGRFLETEEGGGADGSGQAAFSMSIFDCWFSPSSNNIGIFKGGFSNLSVMKTTFEGSKTGCFILLGAGNSDQQHIGIVLNNGYDSYIYGALDTDVKAVITVDDLHAYQWNRGPLFEIKNSTRLRVTNLTLEANPSNVGDVAICKLTNSDAEFSDVSALSRDSNPQCAVGWGFAGDTKLRISDCQSDALTGLKFGGDPSTGTPGNEDTYTGTYDVVIENCDFTGCDNAVTWQGTLDGDFTFVNCRFNRSQAYGLIVLSGTHSWNLTLIDCEIVNAGLRGTATDRNFDIATSGAVRLIRCKIGQNNGSAAATHYIRAVGSGTFDVIDPIPVGTPPTAFVTGTQTVRFDGVNSDMAGMLAFTPSLGGNTTYTVQVGFWKIAARVLHFWGQLTVNAIGTGSANTISGLPYASSATANLNGGGTIFEASGMNANLTAAPTLLIGSNATSATIKGFTAAATADATVNIMTSGTNIRFMGSYPLP